MKTPVIYVAPGQPHCPACGCVAGYRWDLPCPACDRTAEEARELRSAGPVPDWLERRNGLLPLVAEHVLLEERLERSRQIFLRRSRATPEDPIVEKLRNIFDRRRAEASGSFLRLTRNGLKYGELPKLRRIIAEGRLPRAS
jgi:hypothetical protein